MRHHIHATAFIGCQLLDLTKPLRNGTDARFPGGFWLEPYPTKSDADANTS